VNIMSPSMWSYFYLWWITLQVKLTEKNNPFSGSVYWTSYKHQPLIYYVCLNKEQGKRLLKYHHSTCLRYIKNEWSNHQFVSKTKMVVVLMNVLKMPHKATQICWNAVTQTLALRFILTIYTLQTQVLHAWRMNV
jgi:hypothetical protein